MNEEKIQPNKVSRLQRRINICEAIYSDLIRNNFDEEKKIKNYYQDGWSDFEWRIYKNYIKNKREYLNKIEDFLKCNWKIQRLNLSVLAIILEAIIEYSVYETSPAILIQQSILLVDKYGEDEYKFVHAVIDKYVQKLRQKKKN